MSATSLIIPYGFHPFDICYDYPTFWYYVKIAFVILCFFSHILYCYVFLSLFHPKQKKSLSHSYSPSKTSKLCLLVGETEQQQPIYLSEKGLYQNILITGTIGCGKTSSAMYPFCKQLLSYEANNPSKKIGMLVLDVKGNFYQQVMVCAKQYSRLQDVILIGPHSPHTYNPLDKPFLTPTVLANRLKTILTLLSPNNTESFWLDKVEQLLAESIRLCRLYCNGYVTFSEIHKLIHNSRYYQEKIEQLKQSFHKNLLSEKELHDLLSCIDFFENEFFQLDSRTSSILKSELSRITSPFLSDYQMKKHFCCPKSAITFSGFQEVLAKGKIVVFVMPIAEYTNLAKIMSCYLKLDFQSEVLLQLKNPPSEHHTSCFLCDEFHELVTSTDASFFSQSREAKCINILATQSFSSLLNTLNNENQTKVILQSLTNKLCFRTDDIYTIESLQKQLGKEEKEKISKSISENAQETNYNYFLHSFLSNHSNLSESISSYYQTDYIYDTQFFTQQLETFSCLSFLSDGNQILPPQKLKLYPYFKK